MNRTMRRLLFRLLVVAVLVVSPILYPVLLLFLLIADGEWPKGGLGGMYRFAWKQFMRGYP